MFQLLKQLDLWLFHLVNQTLANPVADGIFPALNHGAPFFLLFVAALGWLVYRNSRRHWMVFVVVVGSLILGDAVICYPLKNIFQRPRPAASHHEVRALASGPAGGHSFPSSHTTNAFLAAVLLSTFFRKAAAGWFAGAILVGLSRIYVGVHYPSDVVAGALLGGLGGWGEVVLLGKIWPSLFNDSSPAATGGRVSAGRFTLDDLPSFLSARRWPVMAVLMVLQVIRLAWAAGTSLDAPPGSARLWWLAGPASSSSFPFLQWLGRIWFGLFGSSPLSLWAIPWFFQTLWLGILAIVCWKYPRPEKEGKMTNAKQRIGRLWGLVLLAAILPLVAQLSFFGSPAQILEDADWETSLQVQTLIYNLLLGLPIWVMALARFRSHVCACGIAVLGLILAVSFPSLPWVWLALAVSGVMGLLADWVEQAWSVRDTTARGWSRLLFATLIFYGLITSAAVYNPRLLRKLNLSILPRNNPQYVQTGWREWAYRIRPRLESRPVTWEIWADSPLSRDQLQYWLGPAYRVHSLTDLQGGEFTAKLERALQPEGAFYVREVYLNQINPRVIFLGRRDDWFPPAIQQRRQEMDSTEIFRKGDPVRQLQIYFLPPQPSERSPAR